MWGVIGRSINRRLQKKFGYADEFADIPFDRGFRLIRPEERRLTLEAGNELAQLGAVELNEGGETPATPLEKGEGGDTSRVVELPKRVHGDFFRGDRFTGGLLEFKLRGNGVAFGAAFEVRREDDV